MKSVPAGHTGQHAVVTVPAIIIIIILVVVIIDIAVIMTEGKEYWLTILTPVTMLLKTILAPRPSIARAAMKSLRQMLVVF